MKLLSIVVLLSSAAAAVPTGAVAGTPASLAVTATRTATTPSGPDEPRLPAVGAAPQPVVTEVEPDHLAVLGKIGVGFVGARDLAVGELDNVVAAPTIAARWWISERFGVEFGLGLGHSSGTTTVQQPGATSSVRDENSTWGVAMQLGAPIALAWGAHYTFVVVPETRVGFAWITPGGEPDRPETDNGASGTTFELGGRAGGEIHFGFIGVPELTLEASVGLFMRYVDVSVTAGANGTAATAVTVGTISYADPWDFFRTSLAARYYF